MNLVLNSGPTGEIPDSSEGPVLDQTVYADAVLENSPPETNDIRVNVVNQSPVPLRTEYSSRDFYLYLKNGKRIPLADPEGQQPLRSVPVKKSVEFRPSLGNLSLNHEEIVMIECSFDLGTTRLFLFPRSKKEAIMRLKAVDAQKKNPISGPSKPGTAPKPAITPGNSKAEKSLDEAIKNFKYTPSDRPVKSSKSGKLSKPAEPSGPQVVEFNKKYNYITFNMGSKGGLKKGSTVTVSRGGKAIAKARVKQLRDVYAAATLLTDPGKADIRSGDGVSRA